MTFTVKAIYRDGVLVPAEALDLPQDEWVDVTVNRQAAPPATGPRIGWDYRIPVNRDLSEQIMASDLYEEQD